MKQLNDIYEECKEMFNGIGYYHDVTDIVLNSRLSRAYGRYETGKEEDVKAVVVHEITHNLDHIANGHTDRSLEGHGYNWMSIADDVSKKIGIPITRYSYFEYCETPTTLKGMGFLAKYSQKVSIDNVLL